MDQGESAFSSSARNEGLTGRDSVPNFEPGPIDAMSMHVQSCAPRGCLICCLKLTKPSSSDSSFLRTKGRCSVYVSCAFNSFLPQKFLVPCLTDMLQRAPALAVGEPATQIDRLHTQVALVRKISHATFLVHEIRRGADTQQPPHLKELTAGKTPCEVESTG